MTNVEAIAARGHEYIERMYKDVEPRTHRRPLYADNGRVLRQRAPSDCLTDGERCDIADSYVAGESYAELAVRYDVSVNTIRAVIRREGVVRTDGVPVDAQERKAAMVADRQGGLAISEIAKKYGVAEGRVYKATAASCGGKKRLSRDSAELKARNAGVLKDYKSGMAPTAIAEKYGITTAMITNIRMGAGVPAQHRRCR